MKNVWTARARIYTMFFGLSVFTILSLYFYRNKLTSGYSMFKSYKKFHHFEDNAYSSRLVNDSKVSVNRPIAAKDFDAEYENLCRGEWQRNYSKIHDDNIRTSKRFFVFQCSKAGWANRLRGLLSTFHLSIVTKRAFIIDCQKPSPLQRYLAPNHISWNYTINTTGLSVRFRSPYRLLCKSWKDTDFDTCLNYSVEGLYNTKSQFYEHLKRNFKYNLPRWRHDYQLLGCSFHFLFKKSEYMTSRLKEAREVLGFNENIVVGIHIRQGDSAFQHNKGDVRLAKVEHTDYYFECAEKIDKLIQEKYNTTKVIWFLATDSVKIKNYTKKKYPEKVRQMWGPIEHVGHPTKGNEDAGHLSMFLDFFLLQQSDFRIFTGISTFPYAISLLTMGNDHTGHASYSEKRKKGNAYCSLPKSLRT